MDFNLQDLLGEATAYDKKEAIELSRPQSWLKSVSAFANGEGGTLIFGVKEDNRIVGINDVKAATEKISEYIKPGLSRFPYLPWKSKRLGIKISLCSKLSAEVYARIFMWATVGILPLCASATKAFRQMLKI